MENELFLLQIMAVFTGLSALAMLVGAVSLVFTYRAIAAMRQRSTLFLDQFEPLAGTAQKALDEARSQSSEILTNVKAMSDSSRKQLDKVDALLTDVSSSAKTQIARVDESVLANLQKLQETTDVLQRTVLTPVKEIRGVAAAVNAVVNHLAGGRRPRPDQATLDEEMFI